MSAAEQPKEENFADVTLTKYKTAGEIAAKAIKVVIALCQEGKTVLELCQAGDKAVEEGAAAVYKDKKLPKGSAFPTTISVNNVICNFAPSPSDDASKTALKANDVVKIQLGAQIDGLASIAAETVVVGASAASPVTGKAADAIKAAHTAAEVAIRLMKPGALNHDISKEVEAVIKEFGCSAVEGMQSNQMGKDEIDGKKKIVLNADPGSRPDACKLEENEVYGVDVSVTTSADGKTKSEESRTTIYKKTNSTYLLKMATSRKVFSEIQKKAGAFPFNIRALEDEKRARMGVQECANHGLLTPFHVLVDAKPDAVTAQVFFTVAVNSKGAIRLTPAPSWYNAELVKSDKEVKDEKTKALLATSVRQTKKKNKNKKEEASA
ncbi:Creatinase/aminopeptidase [Violaceomyces palustris]|uniref:Creatinase/aminopeptidase n=1 Tax=Violaceomyces palustris TaxID=1673888 RepID=A0ACD0NWG3_9BASI|nr:Creatinase/aminopeptidase [Violaceomyces palustris]